MYKVVFVRHGLSVWPDKFTGWIDIDIHPSGIEETVKYGKRLKELGYTFDVGFTSYLKRGIKTLHIVLEAMDLLWIPVVKSWKLNERHYGALQGLNKAQTVQKYGEEQVNLWRRSYDTPPPLLSQNDPKHPSHDPYYADVDPSVLPSGECLKDTFKRSVPYWTDTIVPEIKKGKRVIISGHHNSLRAIIKHINSLSEEEIMKVNVPYCIPLVYEFDESFKPIKQYYLAPQEEVERVIQSIKNQTKKKESTEVKK